MHRDSHEYLHNVDVNYALPFGLTLSGSYTYYRTPQQQNRILELQQEEQQILGTTSQKETEPTSGTIFCGQCGKENAANYKFCCKCGAPLA